MIKRAPALLLTVLFSANAGAATSAAPDSLLSHVPNTAIAVAELRRSSLASVHKFFDGDAAMRDELGAFLSRTVGIDLTAVESAVAWSSELFPQPTWAVVLRFAKIGPLKAHKIGAYAGVDLFAVDNWVAAVLADGLVIGSDGEVRRAINVAQKNAPALENESSLRQAFADRTADLVISFNPTATGKADISSVAEQYGARNVSLTLRANNQLALEISGDANKLKTAQALVTSTATVALAQLKQKKDEAAQGADVAGGASAIVTYYQAARIWQEIAPKLVGNKLVSVYQLPDAKSGQTATVGLGIAAAVAIPGVMKYIRAAKTAEASANVRRVVDANVSYAAKHKKPRFPASTPWTPARGCCGNPNDRCVPDAKAWSSPTWKALEFSITDPHYYQYRIVSEGKGASARVTVEARGDLDCDGVFSSYKGSVTLDENGDPVPSTGIESSNALE